MYISGDGRGCTPSGSFTVERIRFDELRRLVDLRVAFTQHCDGNAEATRGVIDWRAAG
jgi:hypothetical protein